MKYNNYKDKSDNDDNISSLCSVIESRSSTVFTPYLFSGRARAPCPTIMHPNRRDHSLWSHPPFYMVIL